MGAHSGRWMTKAMLILTVFLADCGTQGQSSTGPDAGAPSYPPAQVRPLVIVVGAEPPSVATRALVPQGNNTRLSYRLFNALMALIDAEGLPQPELLTSLPVLNTQSWLVFPDGTMETTYTLRPKLTWHDGEALTADDFVFSWRVYGSRELGLSNQAPWASISDVRAIDREHFSIDWKMPYPDAANLSQPGLEFPALPKHILESGFDQSATARESFANQPYWTQQYVGLGPYRLQQWQPGSFIEGIGFDGYALGAPKIARIQVRFSGDQNVVLASLLAGEVQVATDTSLPDVPEALMEEWSRTNAGTVFQLPRTWEGLSFQLRPELASPGAILDRRVRQAIAHAVDKQAIADVAFAGHALFADTPVMAHSEWGSALDQSIPVYPLDLRATEQLMSQAGVTKGSDGVYRDSAGRLAPLEVAATQTPNSTLELPVAANSLKVAGIDTEQRFFGAALSADNQLRATFPGIQLTGITMGAVALGTLASAQIPTADNRWLGANRGGWSSAEYDRLLSTFSTTLDQSDRVGLVRQMLRISNDELPWISLFFKAGSFASVAGLKGPAPAAPEANVGWNMHAWEFGEGGRRE